jgi:hypothetical protein
MSGGNQCRSSPAHGGGFRLVGRQGGDRFSQGAGFMGLHDHSAPGLPHKIGLAWKIGYHGGHTGGQGFQ